MAQLYVGGREKDPTISIEALSDWLQAKVSEAVFLENKYRRVYSVGPKIALGATVQQDTLIAAIRSELMFAVGTSEFKDCAQAISEVCIKLAAPTGRDLTSAKLILSRTGKSALQRSVFDAISFDLVYVENIH